MGEQRSGSTVWNERISLREWCEETAAQIMDARRMLDHWLKELTYYVEGDGTTHPEREEIICECTRMVVVAGETLHNLTGIFVTWSKKPAPDSVWDPDLAARTDRLLGMAANKVRTSPYSDNCTERLGYVREKWQQWCPRFEAQQAPAR